jgi:hypothetical protein
MSTKIRTLLLALLAVVIGGGTIIVTTDDNGPAPAKSVEITVPVPGPDQVVKADKDNNLDRGEQKEAADAGIDLHEDTRDETPPGVSPGQIAQGEEATEKLQDEQLVPPEQPGGAQNYSCQRRYVVNRSALTSRRSGVALHFTVSDPGSLNAIFGLFNRRSFGASSNYGFEPINLRCQIWVPESQKAWAQLAANSAYVSIEIMSRDRSRASWLALPMIKKGTLAALVRDISKRHGTPMKHVDPRGCVWTPGIVDHDDLECGNNHWDVGKNFPWDVFIRQVRAGVAPSCNKTCARRKRDRATHAELRSRHCAPRRADARRARCVFLYKRLAAVHHVLGKPAPR